MKVWTGTEWVPIGPEVAQVTYSANSPNGPIAGSFWVKSTTKELFVWTGSEWVSTGGGASKSNIMFLAGI